MRALTRGGIAGLLLLLAAPAVGSAAGFDGTLDKTCVARDIAVFDLIERRGDDKTVEVQALSDAFFELLDARRACREGRVAGAMTMYGDIELRLSGAGSNALLRGRS